MAKVYVKFRGDEVEVKYRDYGYESDTNAHTIEWEFTGDLPPDLTDEEQGDIDKQLYEIATDPHRDSGLYD